MKTVRILIGIFAFMAILASGLVFAYDNNWLFCKAPSNSGGIEVVWRAGCLPMLFGEFGQKLGEYTQYTADKIWESDFYKSGSAILVMTSFNIFVLNFLDWSKLYRNRKITALILWPIFPTMVTIIDENEGIASAEFAFAGMLISIFDLLIFLINAFRWM